jgi:hypothetical protein
VPISFDCLFCKKRMNVSRQFSGRLGKCPNCAKPVRVPVEPGRETGSGEIPAFELDSKDELVNTLAPPSDTPGQPELGEEQLRAAQAALELERAKLQYDKRRLGRSSGQAKALDGADAEPDESDAVDRVECPDCAELVKAKAKVCRFCGADLTKPGRRTRSGRRKARGRDEAAHGSPRGARSGAAAAAFAFLVPGLGHAYAGRWLAGIAIFMLLAGFVGAKYHRVDSEFGLGFWFGFGVPAFFLWVWQIIDAYYSAERANRAPRPRGIRH